MGCTCSCVGSDDYNDPEKYGSYVLDPLHALTPAAAYNARLGGSSPAPVLVSDPSAAARQPTVAEALVAAYAEIDDAYDAKSGGEPTEEPDEDMIDNHRGQYVLNAYIRHGINASADQYPAPAMPLSVINAARRNVSAWICHVVSPHEAAAMEADAAAASTSASEKLKRKLGTSYEATSPHSSMAASDKASQGSSRAPIDPEAPIVSGTSESVSGCKGHPPAAGWNTLGAFPVKHRAQGVAAAAAAAAGLTATPTLTNSHSKGSSALHPSRSSHTTSSSLKHRHTGGRQVDVTGTDAVAAPDFSCGIMISHASADATMSSL
jgi:hypothetical protein